MYIYLFVSETCEAFVKHLSALLSTKTHLFCLLFANYEYIHMYVYLCIENHTYIYTYSYNEITVS